MKHAFFIIGCPGSGKDVLIKRLSERFCLPEFTFDQTEKISSLELKENFIVKGMGDDLERIYNIKCKLEQYNYMTSFILVDIEESILYERAINLTENKLNKFHETKLNIQFFESMFDNYYLFDNNNSLDNNNKNIEECENFVRKTINKIDHIKEKFSNNIRDYVYKNFMKDKESKKDKTPKKFYSHSTLTPDGYNEYDIRTSGSSNVVHYSEDISSPEDLMSLTGMSFSNKDDSLQPEPNSVTIQKKKTSNPKFNSPAKPPVFNRLSKILKK